MNESNYDEKTLTWEIDNKIYKFSSVEEMRKYKEDHLKEK